VKLGNFVVSTEPDVRVIPVEASCNRCLILGTYGLWGSAVVLSGEAQQRDASYAGAKRGIFEIMDQSV
jgi:hypothetical protein